MKTYQVSLMSQVTLLSHLFETLYEIKRLKWKTTHTYNFTHAKYIFGLFNGL